MFIGLFGSYAKDTANEDSTRYYLCLRKILEFIMTAPTQAKKIIDSLPQDSSYDEILKELAFDRMIQRGLKDSQENKTISNQEMKNRIKQW